MSSSYLFDTGQFFNIFLPYRHITIILLEMSLFGIGFSMLNILPLLILVNFICVWSNLNSLRVCPFVCKEIFLEWLLYCFATPKVYTLTPILFLLSRLSQPSGAMNNKMAVNHNEQLECKMKAYLATSQCRRK